MLTKRPLFCGVWILVLFILVFSGCASAGSGNSPAAPPNPRPVLVATRVPQPVRTPPPRPGSSLIVSGVACREI